MNPDVSKVLLQIKDAAGDPKIDDASFRQRVRRAVARLAKALSLQAASSEPPAARTRRARGAARRPPYRFVAVPNGDGGTTSVSIKSDDFDRLSRTLGGADQVTRLARKVVAGHRPDSGMTRSAYVLKRLLRHAETQARKAAETVVAPARSRAAPRRAVAAARKTDT